MRPRLLRSALVPQLLVALVAAALAGAGAVPAGAQVAPEQRAAVLLETARTFEARDQWEVAAAIYRLIVDTYGDTPAAADARARLASPPSGVALGDGRVALRVWSTLYGAWLGVAVPGALGADSSEPYGVGLLLGAPAGFLVGRSIARGRDLTEGQVSVVSLGAWWGTWQGFGWREVFEIGVAQDCPPATGGDFCYDTEDSAEEAFAAAIIGGVAGITAGALLARREITPGTGTAMNFGPLWGTWFGVATGVLMGLDDDDLLAMTLVGGNAGLVATAALAPGWNVSRSRARLVSIAGVLGGLAGAGVDLLFQPDDEKVAIAIPLLGSIAGLALGVGATRENPGSGGGLPDRAGRPGASPFGSGFLVDLRDGRLELGAPLPTPTLLPAASGDPRAWVPALRIGLFHARF